MAADQKDSAAIITGLREAARLTDVHAKADGKFFVLEKTELRHAPAMLEMFGADAPRRAAFAKWKLSKENKRILRLLSRLRSDIDIVLGALTPILIEDPLHANAAALLRRYGAGLLDLSLEIDGGVHSPLHQAVSAACEPMFLYADHLEKATRTADSLIKDVMQMRHKMEGLLGTVIVFYSHGHDATDLEEEEENPEAATAAAEAEAEAATTTAEAATAAEAATETTAIDGLRHALLLTATHTPTPGRYVVNSVHVGDAPAMFHLLEKAQREEGWIVPRTTKLGHLARICNESDILFHGVLPALLDDPTNPSACRLLNRYAWSLDHVAYKLDRPEDGVDRPEASFAVAVGTVSKFLRRHAEHVLSSTRDVGWLRNNVDEMGEKIKELKALGVVIPPDKKDARRTPPSHHA